MTDDKTAPTTPAKTGPDRVDQAAADGADAPHTEILSPGRKPQPRAKVMPPELGDDDDDLFNDMPV